MLAGHDPLWSHPFRVLLERSRALLIAIALALSCGVQHERRQAVLPHVSARTPATHADVAVLLADVAVQKLCPELTNLMVPLRDEVQPAGPASGEVPVLGRWWIQACVLQRHGVQISLNLAGVGWIWVDREESGFRVEQYVYFRARSTVVGVLDLAYEPESKIVSVWFIPVAEPQADGEGLGEVTASANSFGATLLNVVTLGLTGSAADSKAKRRVNEAVRTRMADTLRRGLTVTYSLVSDQRDVLLQLLPRGVMPSRPFKDSTPWLVNERLQLHGDRGGVHVAGPFRPVGGVSIDVRMERGTMPIFSVGCEDAVTDWLAPVTRGITPTRIFGVPARASNDTLELRATGCGRWYIVAQTQGPSTFAVRVRSHGLTLPNQ